MLIRLVDLQGALAHTHALRAHTSRKCVLSTRLRCLPRTSRHCAPQCHHHAPRKPCASKQTRHIHIHTQSATQEVLIWAMLRNWPRQRWPPDSTESACERDRNGKPVRSVRKCIHKLSPSAIVLFSCCTRRSLPGPAGPGGRERDERDVNRASPLRFNRECGGCNSIEYINSIQWL